MQIKGQEKADREEQEEVVYSLSDYEEDGMWPHVNPTEHAQAESGHPLQAAAVDSDQDSYFSIVKCSDSDAILSTEDDGSEEESYSHACIIM